MLRVGKWTPKPAAYVTVEISTSLIRWKSTETNAYIDRRDWLAIYMYLPGVS